jgi:FtsH-binding integral membrane protein
MNFPDSRLVTGYWLAVMVFIVGAMCFFFLGRSSAKFKQKVFYWYIGIGGILVMGWFLMLAGPKSLLLFIPAYAIAAFISLKTTRFCDACGKTLMNQFVRARYCPRCGADLDAQAGAP